MTTSPSGIIFLNLTEEERKIANGLMIDHLNWEIETIPIFRFLPKRELFPWELSREQIISLLSPEQAKEISNLNL